MYKSKAALLSVANLRILTKVCRSSSISSDSAKPLGSFLRNLSNAAEKSDFDNGFNGFGPENYARTPTNGRFQQYSDILNNGTVNATAQNGSFPPGYAEYENRDEFKQNTVRQNGNYDTYHWGNSGNLWESSSGFNADSYRGSQNSSAPQVVNNSELAYMQQQQQHHHYTVHGKTVVGSTENVIGHNENVNHRPQQSVGNYHLESQPNVHMHQSSGALNGSSGNVIGHNVNVNEGFEHNLGGYFDVNHRPQQSVGNYHLEGQPNVPTHHSSGALNGPHRLGNYFDGNHRPQKSVGNYHLEGQPNVSTHQASGGYQQQTSGSNYLNAGNTLWNSNESIVDPQIHRDEDDGSIKGTIDELDHFCKDGKIEEAIKVLGLLEQQHVAVDLPRYMSLIMLCAENRAVEEAKSVHTHLTRSGIPLEVKTYNKVLEMYGKCGSMDDSLAVFNQMQKRNITSWDRMVTWFGRNGQGEDAIEIFTQFKELGWKPDAKIFLGVFSACGEVGDIIEGMLHFESMSKNYGIVPSMDHYVSVVNMMGSAGYLDEALEFIERMPIEPSVDVWKALMNFCRIHGNSELGDRCTEIVEILEPSSLDEQSRAGLIPIIGSDISKEKRVQKSASQSLLEARSRVHEYRAGDRSCPDHEKLYALLAGLKQQMKEAGYIAEVKFVLHDIDPEGKEEAIMAHSEKLAVARGLIDSPARASIRIIKNLRICGDCHSAMKIISKLVGRELIIRDAKRFHHFRDGLCSCRDYW